MQKHVLKYSLISLLLLPFLALADTNTVFQKSRDYLVVPSNPSTDMLKNTSPNISHKNKITVIEFFSYGCPACFKLDPYLEQWLLHKPANIIFERIPVVFDPDWTVYAKTYLALAELHQAQKLSPVIFNAIHVENKDLSNKDSMANFLNTHGLKKEIFLDHYNSPEIDIQMAKNKKITNDFMIFQIPGIVIDSKYKVDPSLSGGDYPRLIDTVNYLIHLEKHGSAAHVKKAAVNNR